MGKSPEQILFAKCFATEILRTLSEL
jgi:hypothetical protein